MDLECTTTSSENPGETIVDLIRHYGTISLNNLVDLTGEDPVAIHEFCTELWQAGVVDRQVVYRWAWDLVSD
jgi:predicted transcriptional regulator